MSPASEVRKETGLPGGAAMETSVAAVCAHVGRLTWAPGRVGHTADGSYQLSADFFLFLHFFRIKRVFFLQVTLNLNTSSLNYLRKIEFCNSTKRKQLLFLRGKTQLKSHSSLVGFELFSRLEIVSLAKLIRSSNRILSYSDNVKAIDGYC